MGMNSDFESRLNNLIAASGGRIWLVSGHRDTETQARLWEEAVAQYGEEEARNWVAPPGYSNHEKGIAADLGGDLELAAQLAPQFGLYRPMDWEPWHFEPVGSREEGGAMAYTNSPNGTAQPGQAAQSSSYTDVLNRLIGSVNIFDMAKPPVPGLRQSIGKSTLNPARKAAPVFTSSSGGPDGIDAFMRALRDVESSGDYGAIGVATPWGHATGAYQFLDSTWGGYAGYARAADAPPEVQDQRARELMQEYYNQFGDWDSVAAAWYSGPGGNWASGEVQEYVGKVKSRL